MQTADLRKGHPIADAIGAAFRGARHGDDRTRRNIAGWVKLLGGGGLAVWVAVVAVQDWREQAKLVRKESAAAQMALVAALREQTVSIDNLVWAITDDRINRQREMDAIMSKLRITPPTPTKSPRPKPPDFDPSRETP